jgi:tetratricopeptide (TPR) repeat protein
LQRAASHVEHGQLEQGAAALERALGLAPRDAELWQQLAEMRLLQGELKQAEVMATKSNQLTEDPALRARNATLIAAAQGASPPRKASVVRVPPGHLPPPGKCRIWFDHRLRHSHGATGSGSRHNPTLPFRAEASASS